MAKYAIEGVLPDGYSFKEGHLHNSGEGVHSGDTATVKRIEAQFFWTSLKQDVGR